MGGGTYVPGLVAFFFDLTELASKGGVLAICKRQGSIYFRHIVLM